MQDTVAQSVRLRLDIAYDGTDFHGWAAQPGLRTVEGVLTDALSTILRVPVVLTVAGRTDAGVHARGQVAHLDVEASAFQAVPGRSTRTPEEALASRLRGVLAREAGTQGGPRGTSDVAVQKIEQVPGDFDARFSALAREYTYRIATHDFDPLRRHDVLWLPGQRLDVEAMNAAAQQLLGEHNFLSYCRPREGATTIRELQRLEVVPEGGAGEESGILAVHARADAFGHSMVRTLVGTLLRVGNGTRGVDWPRQRLEECNRTGEVVIAPPHPLTLERIIYPRPESFGERARLTRRVRTLNGVGEASERPDWGEGNQARETQGVGEASQARETRGAGEASPARGERPAGEGNNAD
ncbi:tRNA pseudouridine(38-40) synthase TruA [Actinobaculum massiliense]|uniref:tRNA pseudouridine synthase A n=1 Tax=Actinobaculum massiliense ACS-171-V-Col2 TaxID=883066 RepID=K9EDV6_9ACTO|nr:tRNA pseudouridine(38-40) synthase TruA [Actinobaculum massiliense]EKU94848.1 tRNA pseudouridine synthase A [Actinobaculum massiliense ACS-171-V-Col2]